MRVATVFTGACAATAGPAQDWGTASLTGLGTWQLTWVGLDVMECLVTRTPAPRSSDLGAGG